MQRQTRYAKSGRVSVAYQVVGEGAVDLILVPGFVSHLEVAWEEPRLAHFLGRLASFARLIVFDKRGTGMSDPVDRPHTIDNVSERHHLLLPPRQNTVAARYQPNDEGPEEPVE